MLYVLIKAIHLVSILVMVSTLFAELVLVKNEMTRAEIKRVGKLDGFYGLAAILVVAGGLTLWLGVGKPSTFYTENPVFHIKVSLAILVGLISIIPTRFYIRQGKGELKDVVLIPTKIRRLIVIQLLLLLVIPFLASAMAVGLGTS